MKTYLALLCLIAVAFNRVPSVNGEPEINWDRLSSNLSLDQVFPVLNHTRFQLYTQENPKKYQELLPFDESFSLDTTNFNASNPTRIIVHGWLNDGESDAIILVRNAYLQTGEFNVIGVDWSKESMSPNYFNAFYQVPTVGAVVALLVQYLKVVASVDPSKVYIIGHSLGAHIAGYAGKHLEENGAATLGVIVGLDPAEPLFSWAHPADRLAITDAKYVQIIKTSIVGIGVEVGHANFYPNGGLDQPGCLLNVGCNHGRSFEFFADSILNEAVGVHCTSYLMMGKVWCTGPQGVMGGEPLNTSTLGPYWLPTADKSPFFYKMEGF